MPKITGTFLQADGTPSSGAVAFAPSAAIGDGPTVLLPAPAEVHLDATGSFEVTLPATNDPDYTPSGWVWQVRERIAGGRDAWHFELTADADYWDLTTVLPPDDYLPWTFTASATTGAPGTDADVDVSNVGPAVAFAFDIPRGDPGPTTDLSVGTVTTGAPGSSASADITGTPPTLELDLTIPRGDVGATGPANELTIGTVTTGAAGTDAAATITGTPPSQTLSLTIPRGATGDIAPANVGNLLTSNQATGTDTLATTAGFTGAGLDLTSSTVRALFGTRSLLATATGAAASVALTAVSVTPGQTYTGFTFASSSNSTTPFRFAISWRDSANAQLSAIFGDSLALADGWTRYAITGAAPAGAVTAIASVVRTSANPSAGALIYLDALSFHVGAGGLWVPPGVPVPNLGSRANPANATQAQVWNPGNSTWITV